jgi:hypothetical protein
VSGLSLPQIGGAEIAAAVTEREYKRLLQFPRDQELDGDLRDRADGARNWYAHHGVPFLAAQRVDLREVSGDRIALAGADLCSITLARRLEAGEAHALMIVATSAGIEAAEEAARLWADQRPDESYFLDRFAVAVAERLLFQASGYLCRSSEAGNETLMPHLSPGCGNWDIADQHKLMALLCGGARIGPLELLPSGALHPQHSVLAAMGVTRRKYPGAPELLCRACDLAPCAFRRAPYGGA